MELLQEIATGIFSIKADGHEAANPGVYIDRTNNIGSWVRNGLSLSDGKVVKAEVKRIVELKAGDTLDDKFNALGNNDIKLVAGKELLFDLLEGTLTAALMTQEEYQDARKYRLNKSIEARRRRWQGLMSELSDPAILAESSKIAFLDEVLRTFQDDYLMSDNKIFEAFINGTDHALDALVGYGRFGVLDFGTTPALSLMGLALWDAPVDADYKTLVTDIIKNCIINTTQYIS